VCVCVCVCEQEAVCVCVCVCVCFTCPLRSRVEDSLSTNVEAKDLEMYLPCYF
jgi:hypothetical protein